MFFPNAGALSKIFPDDDRERLETLLNQQALYIDAFVIKNTINTEPYQEK